MEYYRIIQMEYGGNVIQPPSLSTSKIWSEKEPFFVTGTAKEPYGDLVFLPVYYTSNTFLVSNPLRAIWERYQRGGRYRQCAFGSAEQRKVKPYSYMMPRILECVHPDTTYFANGEVNTLCLNKEEIGANKVFGISARRHIMLFLACDVLEEIMCENITGFQWKQVAVC